MIPRIHRQVVEKRLRAFPVVAIVGPRQAGKTTLARSIGGVYFDLEQEKDRLSLDLQWEALTEKDGLIILDEAQAWPKVFPRLRGAIDTRRKRTGRFLLLGSVSPALMREVGESLAGRLAIVELAPLLAAELPTAFHDAAWRCGGFPDGGTLELDGISFPVWQKNYLSQLAQRDFPTWGLPARPRDTERFLSLLAAGNASAINASQLGRSLGVSYHTVQSYLDFLENAFLIRRLRPFYASNFQKRLTKASKFYLRDSGLLHALLGCDGRTRLFDQPWVGNSWEGWVVEQILSARSALGESFDAYFFRTGDGLECDLLIESGGAREVIEIKLSATPSEASFRKLEKIARLVGATRQVLISRIPDEDAVHSNERWSTNLGQYLGQLGIRPPPPEQFPSLPNARTIFRALENSAGALVERGVVSRETLVRRAEWLKHDVEILDFERFEILPTRWVPAGEAGMIPLVEYDFGQTNFDLNNAKDPWNVGKDTSEMDGSFLSRGDLGHFAKVCEIGRERAPHLWLGNFALQARLRDPRTHLNTLNEIWWLSRWHGVDTESVAYEAIVRRDRENLEKSTPSTADWRFTVLGGQIAINLSVKNRVGTAGCRAMGKPLELQHLFPTKKSDLPDRPFAESGENEINVLAITAYHGGHIERTAEADLVAQYLDRELPRPVIDAVALSVVSGDTSYDAPLFFPSGRPLAKKDLLLRAIFEPMDAEDSSRVGVQRFPQSISDVIAVATQGNKS